MKNLLPFYFRGDIMHYENIIKEIIDIDNKAKDNLKDVIEKKRNFEKYAKQEICIKEGALFAKYKDTLEKDEREYTIKLQEEKSIIEENIFDIAGVRVIGSFLEDIYDLANYFLKQDDVHLIETKDYIQHPKPNGYRSLHLIVEIPIFLANEKKWVKVEVQFRTIAMNFWASLEHKLRYKKELSQERLAEIDSELLERAKLCATLDQKMQNIKGSKLAQEL